MTSSTHTRLLPLHIAVALQGFMLWVPIEKLFMTEIGFDAAGVGIMAAAYAAVVPLVEVPSGILADRWSRRGVLIISAVALAGTSLLGGLSTNVPTYIGSALILGVYFAMYSGTMDSVVYDTILEETGGSACFERAIGRIRLTTSVSLTVSSLAGGWIASLLTTRATYFLTVPFAVLSALAYLRFREPLLHRTSEPTSLRHHLAVTYRTLTGQRRLLPVIVIAVLSSVLLQTVFEFGPLWLVALAAPAVLFGPYWAGLMSTLGLGGLVVGWLDMDRRSVLAGVGTTMTIAGLVLTTSRNVVLVTGAQIVLALLMVACGIHITRVLHDAVPSTVRTGVASGVSALGWILFLPFSLVFGMISDAHGVHAAAMMLVVGAALIGVVLAKTQHVPAADVVPRPACEPDLVRQDSRNASSPSLTS
jgi:MFS family permease